MNSEVQAEIAARKNAERAKALEKYGPEAVQPGGRPEFDILDFAVNEVIGLDRYGEMLQHRFSNDPDVELLGQALRDFSQLAAPKLVAARQRLLRAGLAMGVTEQNRFDLPDNQHAQRTLLRGEAF